MIEYDDTKHEYKLDGRVLPSVTQILSAVFPEMYDYSYVDENLLQGTQEYGSAVHKCIQDYLETKDVPATASPELLNFMQLWTKIDDSIIADVVDCEKILYNDDFAGRADIIVTNPEGKIYIFDIKTTSQKYRSKVQQQLSLYAYLIGSDKVAGISEIWLHNNDCSLEELKYKGDEWCNQVIEAYYNNITLPTTQELSTVDKDLVAKATEYFDMYVKAEEFLKQFKDTLLEQMLAQGITKAKFGRFTATLRAESISKRFDSAKFKKEHPEMIADYEKEVKVSASVVLNKGDDND